MQHVRALGFPAPEVFDAAGPDLVMERVDGRRHAAGGGPLVVGPERRRPRTAGHVPVSAGAGRLGRDRMISVQAAAWLAVGLFTVGWLGRRTLLGRAVRETGVIFALYA